MTVDKLQSLIAGFLANDRPAMVCNRHWAFRLFAEYVGHSRDEWSRSLGNTLDLDAAKAIRRIEGFRGWLTQDRGMSAGATRKCVHTVRPFFEYARKCGVIRWQPRHRRRERTARLWKACAPPFRRLAREWLDSVANRNYSVNTQRGYRCELLRFGQFLGRSRVDLAHVGRPLLERWIGEMKSEGLGACTIDHRVTTARSFYKWQIARKILATNPVSLLPRTKLPGPVPRHVSEGEMLKVIQAADSPRDRALLEFLYSTGCRASEVARMNVSQVSFRMRTARAVGKGQRERVVCLTRPAVRALKSYLLKRTALLHRVGRDSEPALFVNEIGNRLQPDRICVAVQRIARKVGLLGRLTPHVIRHSFATHLLNRGAEFEAIQRLLGHTRIDATSIYAHLVPSRVRAIYRKACPRP